MLNFKEFFTKYNGLGNIGNTPENMGQCVGLVELWIRNLGFGQVWGNAKDLLNDADKNSFDIIPNTPDGVPLEGDIVVWSAEYNGTVGHTGIATGVGDTNTFECFEQNDPLNSSCHLRTYNYDFVLGWMHPKVTIPTVDELSVCHSDRDENWNCFTALTNKLTVPSDPENKELMKQHALTAIDALTGDISAKQQTITNLNKQIPDFELEIGTLKNQVTDLTQKLNIATEQAGKNAGSQVLYEEANKQLVICQAKLIANEITYNQSLTQLKNGSITTAGSMMLFGQMLKNIFHIK